MGPGAGKSRPSEPAASAVVFLTLTAAVFASHLPYLGLPDYWDELGQFIPAALDIFHDGAWIPHSTVPNIHPPAVMGYLAMAWKLFGYHPATTRGAMLLLGCCSLLATWALAKQLLREVTVAPALLATAMLCVSPLFFAQSMMAQLDAPATLFTALALLFFLQDRFLVSAGACVMLVLVKETGLVTPLLCALWLARERRWRAAALYFAPCIALAAWVLAIALHTGHWMGNSDFLHYNLYEPLHPVRILVTLVRRLYFLLAADFHWIGSAAVVWAWRTGGLFRSRSWAIAGSLVAAHVAIFTLLGGAVLERYLLPAMPIVYIAMAGALWRLGRPLRWAAAMVLLAGLVASNFVNPPYAFPLEDNLAFTDYLKLHQQAGDYLEARYPSARVDTVWPMTAELSHPEFAFVHRPLAVRLLPDLTPETLASVDWSNVQILAAFSRDVPKPRFWRRLYRDFPGITRDELHARVPFPPAARFDRHGQWLDLYVNPAYSLR
jgi:4-amino-4-deoxy-L-arabinose transferase-like glycosyltransferase